MNMTIAGLRQIIMDSDRCFWIQHGGLLERTVQAIWDAYGYRRVTNEPHVR